MAILIMNDGDKIVNTIADRDSITKKFDGMQVTVKDAIADINVGEGEALYQWSTDKNRWILIGKDSKDNLEFITETATLVGGKVTATEVPQSGLVWDCFVKDSNGLIIADITAPAVTVKEINIGSTAYDGSTLHFTYGYGKIQAAIVSVMGDGGLLSIDTSTPSNMTGVVVADGTQLTAKTLTPSDISGFDAQAVTATASAISSAVSTAVTDLVGGAPGALDTLKEIADQLASDESAVSALTTTVGTKAATTYVDAELAKKADTSSLATVAVSGSYTDLTSKPTLFSGSYADLSNKPTIPTVPTNVSDFANDSGYQTSAQVSTAITTAVSTKAPIDSPTFTGTVAGITAAMVGLGNVDNTADLSKPVSTAMQTALDAKAALAGSLTQDFSVNDLTVSGNILPNANGTLDIGSSTLRFKTIFVDEARLSTNTLYIGDTPIMGTTNNTINIHADLDQSINIKTTGTGNTTLESAKATTITTTGTNSDVFFNATGAGSNVRVGAANEFQVTALAVSINAPITGTSQTLTGNLTVGGNLIVNGTQTTINSTSVTTKDNIIILNNGEAGSGVTAGTAGFRVDRGDSVDYELTFDESDDFFKLGAQGSTEIIATRPWATNAFAAANHNHTVDSLSNVLITSKASGDVLKWNGTSWVNSAVSVTKSDVGLGNVDNTSDASKPVSTATQTALNLKANLASPTFTGTVSGITATMVGLTNVDNTSDASKPVSTATQTALDLKAPLASPTFTGTVSGITKAMVGLGSVDNTSDASKPVSTATQSALDAKAPLASPTFTGTVSGITKTMVGLGSVDNTSDAAKPVSTATQTALDLKANQATTYTKTETDSRIQTVIGAAPAALDTLVELAAALGNDANYASTITSSLAFKAPLASPTFTGTVSGITATMVGLGSVTNDKQLKDSQTLAVTGDATASATALNTGTIALTLASVGTSGTYVKVTTDAKGRVTSGVAALVAADIPALDWAKITTGKPTTLAGYGIADAAAASHTQAWSTITSTPTTLAGYGITDAGYLNIPQVSNSANYTTVLTDSGKHLLHPSADTTARTFTIAANASVAYPIGTTIAFVNQNGAGALTIAIATDTMRLAGAGTTGSRTLAANGIATAVKIASTEWIISGTNLT